MEILMKLKCAPAASPRPPHSTLKVVDHHQQLQQQHIVGTHFQSPPPPSPTSLSHQSPSSRLHASPGISSHHPPTSLASTQLQLQSQQPLTTTQQLILPSSCMDYASPPMDCCTAAQQDIIDMQQWGHAASAGRMRSMQPNRAEQCDYAHTNHYAHAQPTSGLSMNCCSAYQPPCCMYAPASLLPPPPLPPPMQLQQQQNVLNASDSPFALYQEPDENFISIDDAKIKNFLLKIGENEQQKRQQAAAAAAKASEQRKANESVIYEIIELDDEETLPTQRDVATPAPTPAPTEVQQVVQQHIVASIDLLDSSSDSEPECTVDNDDDEEELPLAAAAAVSCELEDDVDDEAVTAAAATVAAEDPPSNDVLLLPSDVEEEDEENVDFIDEQEEGVEVRWDELEEQRERNCFECFLCGKKVQSSYNLRRHMMIHTGERPFGCDLCERRFREFSDLKKHRRRHMNERNFVCMICRVNVPTEHDPTRCQACDSRSCAALAAMRPQVTSSPEKSQTPPVQQQQQRNSSSAQKLLTPTKPQSRNVTPAPAATSPALPPLTPIASNSDTQQMLDNVPAVHRPLLGLSSRKEFLCPLCQRPFGTRHNLKRHFMIHTGEKPFSCPKCRKPFREYSTLKKHLVTHKRDRWYKCHLCPQKYRDYLDYVQHKATHPKSESAAAAANQSPAKKKCKKRAEHDDSFDSNEDDSCAEDWLECCECGQRFTDIEAYTEHLKAHDPTVHLYECYICKQSFNERKTLVMHVATHGDNAEDEDAAVAAAVADAVELLKPRGVELTKITK